jgi:predicted ABC-type ATPase
VADEPCLYVLAGTNGAGKSSLVGELLRRSSGVPHYDPDAATRRLLEANPRATLDQANAAAWQQGMRLVLRAIEERLDFAIETTLGGETYVEVFEKALARGIEVRLWYVGLASPELHLARVAARVAKGGHDIPEEKIRERYDRGRENLLRLLPGLTEMKLLDNSVEGDPDRGERPRPELLLHTARRRIVSACALGSTPAWAKPILAAALRWRTPR